MNARPRTFPRSLGALLLGGALASCGVSTSEPSGAGAPETLETVDLAALTARLAPAAGDKAVVVNFWATWCPPCVAEMPELEQLHGRWEDKGVRVLAIALDVALPATEVDSAAEIRAYMDAKGFDLPALVFDGDIYELSERYRLPSAIPVTLVFDASGKEVARREGQGKLAEFEELIARALGP